LRRINESAASVARKYYNTGDNRSAVYLFDINSTDSQIITT